MPPLRPFAFSVVLLAVVAGTAAIGAQVPKQKPGLEPALIQSSDLTVKLERVGSLPMHVNPTSPIVAGSTLLLIDQSGYLYRWDGSQAVEVLSPKTAPPGVKLVGPEPIVGAAATANGSVVYVMFMAAAAPKGVPQRTSPREPDAWTVLFAYEFDGVRLGAAKPITAMEVRTDGHIGGGLIVLPDGSLLFAPGDNGDSFEDGRDLPQDRAVHLGKIVQIDPASGATKIVALGVRYVQRLSIATFDGGPWVIFADPGGWIAEEINAVRLTELVDGTTPINFGWGRNKGDGKAREGTFYVDREGNSVAVIAAAEPGFIEPVAEFGRQGESAVAVSGPVASPKSFARIRLLFGDLPSGAVYAITEAPSKRRQVPLRVNLVDDMGQPTTLKGIAQGERADPRFFNYPDGSAGVLLEKTGSFYRLTELR